MAVKKFKLGQKLRDTISGFEGIAVSEHIFLNGCVQYALKPQELKDGKTIEAEGFDSQQLEVVKDKAVKVPKTNNGGPVPDYVKKMKIS